MDLFPIKLTPNNKFQLFTYAIVGLPLNMALWLVVAGTLAVGAHLGWNLV